MHADASVRLARKTERNKTRNTDKKKTHVWKHTRTHTQKERTGRAFCRSIRECRAATRARAVLRPFAVNFWTICLRERAVQCRSAGGASARPTHTRIQ